MDFGETSLIFEVRGLKTGKYFEQGVGNTYHFEAGVISGSRFYPKGKDQAEAIPVTVNVKRGPAVEGGGEAHFRNFVAAVRSRKVEDLNADILEGHYSSALCHLANISYRLGQQVPFDPRLQAIADNKDASETLARMREHLEKDNSVKLSDTTCRVGKKLLIDASAEAFVNDSAANKLLSREYRKPFVVPDKVS
jgi:hypothetical protein